MGEDTNNNKEVLNQRKNMDEMDKKVYNLGKGVDKMDIWMDGRTDGWTDGHHKDRKTAQM